MEKDFERTDSHLLHISGRRAIVLVLEEEHLGKLIDPQRHIYHMLIDMSALIKWSPQASSNRDSNAVRFLWSSVCTDLCLYLMIQMNKSLYIPEIDMLKGVLCALNKK